MLHYVYGCTLTVIQCKARCHCCVEPLHRVHTSHLQASWCWRRTRSVLLQLLHLSHKALQRAADTASFPCTHVYPQASWFWRRTCSGRSSTCTARPTCS